MAKLGLTLNEAKTSVKDARTESFDFLGYTFGPQRYRKDGHWYLGASPSKRSVQRIKAKVGDILVSGNKEPWPTVSRRLNRLLLGWSAYFGYGTRTAGLSGGRQPRLRSRRAFLRKRHNVQGRGTRRFSDVRSSEDSECCVFDACILGRRRVPRGEASRKAGCGVR